MANLTQLAEQLVNLTVKEVKELTDILKDQYGIEPAAAAVADDSLLCARCCTLNAQGKAAIVSDCQRVIVERG